MQNVFRKLYVVIEAPIIINNLIPLIHIHMKFTSLIFLLSCFLTAGAGDWKAGLGKRNITPSEPIRMGGYAARNRPSDQGANLTDLWVKAISFSDAEGNRAVVVCADIIRFPRFITDSVKRQVQERYGLKREQIVLNGSHTHSGPEVDAGRLKYMAPPEELEVVAAFSQRLIRQTVEAIGESLASPFDALISSGSGTCRFAVNRRNNREGDIGKLSELKGPVDHQVPVIKVTDRSGGVKAILFGYACHPTVLSGYEISGDYPAYAQRSLEEKFPGAQAMFFIGAAGDQNPLPRRSVPLAMKYGRELALAVETVISSPMRSLSPVLSVSYHEIGLRFAKPAPGIRELRAIAADTVSNPNWIVSHAKVLADELSAGKSPGSSYPYPVQVWKLGQLPMVMLGGEIVVEYAWRIRDMLGKETVVMGYSNDQMSYIPSYKVLKEGGYEGERSALFTTPWHDETEKDILKEVKRQALLLKLEVQDRPE